MQFIDLGRQYESAKERIDKAIHDVVNERHFIMGPQVEELEKRLAAYVGRKYCLTCSSGTSALYIPLLAYDVQPEDAVFVSSFTYFASAETIRLAGATPVFIDSDETYLMDPDKLEEAIQKTIAEGKLRPRGIMTVDLFGLPCDYPRIEAIAQKYDLFLLTDDAQAFGGTLDGKQSCAFGDVSATSFFPAKPLGCYGDGGAIFTDDEELYTLMHSLRVHGHGASKYDNVRIGINARLDTLQAAILLVKLDLFDEEVKKKNELRERYDEVLKDTFSTPIIPKGRTTSLAQYTILTESAEEREFLLQEMPKNGVPVMVYYQIPMHEQRAFTELGYAPEDLPVCHSQSQRVLSLPMHAYMTDEEFEQITSTLLRLTKEIRAKRA
ncbi:DegT/DnrJ/EryC1/StrS family aminotransferase [uncultured Murdochiella sp.]|uniref:DegT/DnrJ/EryC1/StrS family aminotransferase n=1 Tax=uncultured Murdochiella sp. TaxID=1586095 RepID=UPI0028052676|nr:DegT/DnrJ/EryC1/StrS family aminotransferase [uncultured Murdochiella sp.]